MIATEIEDRRVSDRSGDVILPGSVATAGLTSPTLKIFGLTVGTSLPDPNNDFKNMNVNPICPKAFFDALMPNGGLAKAKGSLHAPGVNALAAGSLRGV